MDVWRHGAFKRVMRTREQVSITGGSTVEEETIDYSHDIALIHSCIGAASCLSDLLTVHVDAVARSRRVARGQPVLRVLVVKWPRWNDDKECEGGAGEANVECERDVLLREANKEGDDLSK